MKLTAKDIDTWRMTEILSFLGPLETLFAHGDEDLIHLEINGPLCQVTNQPRSADLMARMTINSYGACDYADYRAEIVDMFREHVSSKLYKGKRHQPLESISGHEIIFAALKYHGIELEPAIKRIRTRMEFNQDRRFDDSLVSLGLDKEVKIHTSQNGQKILLERYSDGDLEIGRGNDNETLTMRAVLPLTLTASVVGKKLKDVVAHDMLDELDIDITAADGNYLTIRPRWTNALQQAVPADAIARAEKRVTEWEKTWDSGRDLPAQRR